MRAVRLKWHKNERERERREASEERSLNCISFGFWYSFFVRILDHVCYYL